MVNLNVDNPQLEVTDIVDFLRQTFQEQNIKKAVIAISGGIDSALALTLLSKALAVEQIFPILLPYGEQKMTDAQTIIDFNQIPQANLRSLNIKVTVDQLASIANLNEKSESKQLRLGNMMARTRMILVFDLAKKLEALVVGTENKSERLLAYYTRFGDNASDIEPLTHLYKTEVRTLATILNLPKIFLDKAPSADLWAGQSDEMELGFSYQLADQVLTAHFEQGLSEAEILQDSRFQQLDRQKIEAVFIRLKAGVFKSLVPYKI